MSDPSPRRTKKRHASSVRARQRPLSVIVVDDDEDTREMLRDVLQHSGVEVRLCASIREALAAASSRAPDAVLTDLVLAGEHGRDLAAALRGAPSTAHVVVIAMTGATTATPDVLRHVDAFLTKPVEVMDLAEMVRSLVETVAAARSS